MLLSVLTSFLSARHERSALCIHHSVCLCKSGFKLGGVFESNILPASGVYNIFPYPPAGFKQGGGVFESTSNPNSQPCIEAGKWLIQISPPPLNPAQICLAVLMPRAYEDLGLLLCDCFDQAKRRSPSLRWNMETWLFYVSRMLIVQIDGSTQFRSSWIKPPHASAVTSTCCYTLKVPILFTICSQINGR